MIWFLATSLLVTAVLLATFDRVWVSGLHRARSVGYAAGIALSIAAAPAVAWLSLAALAVYEHLAV